MGLSTFDETFALLETTYVDDSYGPGPQFVSEQGQRNYRVDSLLVTTDDTADHILQLFVQVAGQSWPLGSVTLPAGAGALGILPVDMIATCLPASMVGLVLGPSCGVGYILDAPVASGKHIWAVAFGGIV